MVLNFELREFWGQTIDNTFFSFDFQTTLFFCDFSNFCIILVGVLRLF